MTADAVTSTKFDAHILESLACPVCIGSLQVGDPGLQVICTGCLRAYPLVDGIPVLIPERAVDAKRPA